MDTLTANLEQLIDLGYDILSELEKEDPDLDKIKSLYDKRAHQVEKLSKWPDKKLQHLPKEETEASKNLFTRLNLLEENLNKNLTTLSKYRYKALNDLRVHSKAKASYTLTSGQSKFIDLKSYS